MRRREHIFTRGERKAAVWALVSAMILTASGLAIEQVWRDPPLGLYRFEAPGALPGVMDARPIG
jgi:urea transporter